MVKITIHTATYNRAYILHEAYDSLRKQTCKDFEWIITDDGSTDNTEDLVSQWIKNDNGFNIIYNKLNHVGIPRALNAGINKANTDWFMMLDSDDHLLPNTVELVIKWLKDVEDMHDFAGIGFARCYPNGEYMKKQTPIIDSKLGYVDATHIERKKYNLNMDMCEVHRTNLLKDFPFQYWPTEKYAPEQLNFYEIALKGYKLRWRSEKLYICDYLPDGQTKDNRLVKNNPMGFAMMYNQNMLIEESFRVKCKCAMQMIALTIYSNNLGYLLKSNKPLLTILMFPIGFVLGIRRKIQFDKLK